MDKTSEREALIAETIKCPHCKKAEMIRASKSYITSTIAWCAYHYDKGLATK